MASQVPQAPKPTHGFGMPAASEIIIFGGKMLRKNLIPSALKRNDAAEFCGISLTQFAKMVKLGSLPPARDAGGAKVWLRSELQDSLDGLELAPDKKHGGEDGCADQAFGLGT